MLCICEKNDTTSQLFSSKFECKKWLVYLPISVEKSQTQRQTESKFSFWREKTHRPSHTYNDIFD